LTVRTNLRVLVFPPDDVALRHEVDRALSEVLATTPEPRQMAELTERLRTWYRSIQIRQREPLAGYDDDPTCVWYVYRDGRIRARTERLERLERLYAAMAAARVTVRASENALDKARDSARRGTRAAGSGRGDVQATARPAGGDESGGRRPVRA
jgi:hypothetical protein